MIEPGGYLQWDEADSVDWSVKSVHRSVQTESVQDLFQQLCGTNELVVKPQSLYTLAKRNSWKRDMIQIMNQSGFQNTIYHRVEYSKAMARLWSDVYMSTWEEFAKVVLKTPEASQKLSIQAMDQVRDGSAISCPKLVWVARKA